MDGNPGSGPTDEGPSIIGSGIFVDGDIEADVDLRIRGRVVGDVRCAALVLGEQGEIRGNIFADRIRLSGLVEGAVETGDLALEESARVKGDVTYSRVRMVKGAQVQGRMSHVERDYAVEEDAVGTIGAPPVLKPPTPAGNVRKPVYIE
ncbi:MAG TPA: polymer-forming cytoskeletal protein [Allosphingosinicella sp.]|nr:polymer-forming cytoskeletal protein [Allosphingosinicella sp.]